MALTSHSTLVGYMPARRENQVRLIKMFGLAAIAAIAAMAFMGVSTASATSTVLCSEHPFDSEAGSLKPCPTDKKLEHVHVEGKAGLTLLKGEGGISVHIICHSSTILGTALLLGSPLVGHVSVLSFNECLDCTVTVNDQVGLLKLLKTALNLGTVEAEGFAVSVDCGIECEYGGTVTAGLHAEGSTSSSDLGEISANAAELKKKGGFFCPTTSLWTSNYQIQLPDPVYIAT
jgi:hypothetical protein